MEPLSENLALLSESSEYSQEGKMPSDTVLRDRMATPQSYRGSKDEINDWIGGALWSTSGGGGGELCGNW